MSVDLPSSPPHSTSFHEELTSTLEHIAGELRVGQTALFLIQNQSADHYRTSLPNEKWPWPSLPIGAPIRGFSSLGSEQSQSGKRLPVPVFAAPEQDKLVAILEAIDHSAHREFSPEDEGKLRLFADELAKFLAPKLERGDIDSHPAHFGALVPPNPNISALVEHFVQHYAQSLGRRCPRISVEAMQKICSESWDGRLRELEFCMETAVLACRGEIMNEEHLALPRQINTPLTPPQAVGPAEVIPSGLTLAEVEERYILRTLAEHQGNRTRASQALDIGRNTLVRKLKQYRSRE